MTADKFNYHRIQSMEKHIKNLEAKIRGADDKLEWFESFADYIAEQHANEYNQACHFADENLEIEDRLWKEREEHNNQYIKPLQKL
jgi:hypothetical protein